jgi:hypothetical protein
MRVKYIFLLLLGLIFILNENLLQAAQIDIYSMEEFVNIRLVGKIEKGDAEKFKRLVEDLRQKKRTVNMLMLASIGGDAIEAMRIGTIVRKSFIPTHAPINLDVGFTCNGYPPELKDDDCDCASACFLIWVAGVYRVGDVLGIHRPYFFEEYFEGLSASETQKEYALMYERVRSYLKSMDVPEHIINKMFNTGSDEIAYLDWDTAKSMELAPFFDEWVGASCLRLTSEEEMDYWGLLAKKWEGSSTLTKSEKFYLNYLKKRERNFNKCIREKLKEAQLKEKTTS